MLDLKLIYLFFSIFIYSSCNNTDLKNYGKAIIKDTQKRFEEKKDYLYGLTFKGQITDKFYCKDCKLNRYSVKIKLSGLSQKPNFSNSQFPPYYSFESDSILIIIVSNELYEEVNEKDKVYKKKDSNLLHVGDKNLKFLNERKYEWLP